MRTVPKLVAMLVVGGALQFPSQPAQACRGHKKCSLCAGKGCGGSYGYAANYGYSYGTGSAYSYPNCGGAYGDPYSGYAYSPPYYSYPSY
jgi:hypothetical protein